MPIVHRRRGNAESPIRRPRGLGAQAPRPVHGDRHHLNIRLLPKTGHTRRLMDKLFRPHRDELQVRMELPSIGMIKSFVAADLGVSLISASFARDEVASGRVKLIDLEDAELYRELGLAYRRDRTLSCATTAFIEVLQQLATLKKA